MENLLSEIRSVLEKASLPKEKVEEIIADLETQWHSKIALVWCTEDVQACIQEQYDEILSFDKAMEILKEAEKLKCDGVSWYTFSDLYTIVFE